MKSLSTKKLTFKKLEIVALNETEALEIVGGKHARTTTEYCRMANDIMATREINLLKK